MLTVTLGKAKVGVSVMVGVGVILGVRVNVEVGVIVGVFVGVSVGVNVAVGVGVLVQAAAVAVTAVAVMVACISGDGPQADRTSRDSIALITCCFFRGNPDIMERVYVLEKGLSIGIKEPHVS